MGPPRRHLPSTRLVALPPASSAAEQTGARAVLRGGKRGGDGRAKLLAKMERSTAMTGRSAWKVGLAIASAFSVAGVAQSPAPSAAPPPSGQVASPAPGKSILPSFAPLV